MGLRGPGQVVIQIQIMRSVTPATGITERNRFHWQAFIQRLWWMWQKVLQCEKHPAINQRCFSRMKINELIGKQHKEDSQSLTNTNMNNLGDAVFVCVKCYWHDLKGLAFHFQDCWRHCSLQEHTRISQPTDAEKLCQKQMEGEQRSPLQKIITAQYTEKQKHTVVVFLFGFTFVCLHSKLLMRRLWSATWGACSWAPALAAASTTPTLCPTLRAALQPRASLWTVPRSPRRTVSDTSEALCRRKHIQL